MLKSPVYLAIFAELDKQPKEIFFIIKDMFYGYVANLPEHLTLKQIKPVTDLTKIEAFETKHNYTLLTRVRLKDNNDEYWLNGWNFDLFPADKIYIYTKTFDK
jgi:hypothetical protein